jgi:hypothetical protein
VRTFDIAAKDAFILERDDNALTRHRASSIMSYSHFFHLKIQYGTIAAHSIMISAIG